MKPKIKRINHVQICIPFNEEARARAFYGEVLGLREIEKPEALKQNGGLWFEVADIQLHIGVEDVHGQSKQHPAFEVDDLKGIKQHLQDHGITVKDEVRIPSVERFSFRDPFGNRIEFMELLRK